MFPSRLRDIDPLWKICTQGPFTGYDPPRTLDPAAAIVPKVTPPSDPNPDPRPAKPAATQSNLPKRTTTPADPTKTSSDPSLAKIHGSGGMQEDPSQKNDPPKDSKKAPTDPSSNNQGKTDLPGQSLQDDPTSSDPKNGPINQASSDNAANSDSDQPGNNVHPSGGPSMGDEDTTYQPQPLATSAPAFLTAVLGSHHVSATVKGYNNDGVDVKPGGTVTDVSGQKIAVDPSNNL